MDDRLLVSRVLAGDERAFDTFFSTYFPRLFRFALRRLGREDAAEDVAQATLVRAVRGLAGYRGEAALFTWLCTLCRHEIARHLTRAGHEPALFALDDTHEVRAALEALSAEGDRPDRAFERADVSRLVQLALDYLPGHYGDVLEWKYIHGLSVSEMATRLDTTPKAVESLLTRARAAFREGFSALVEAS